MTPTKFLVGQIVVVFAVAIGGLWFATQWAAWQLGYQAQLGAPWFSIFGHPMYRPWSLFGWWYAYDAYAPHLFNKAGMIAALSGFAGCAAAIIGSLWRARQSRLVDHLRLVALGDDRTKSSRPVVPRRGRFPRADRRRISASRRAGTCHGVRADTVRQGRWAGRADAVVLDAKCRHPRHQGRELATDGRLAQPVLTLPAVQSDRPASARYNPLLEVRKGPDEVRDVQNIADILVDPEGALERRNHWEKTSHSLAGRRNPSCPLCRGRKDAGARREFPVRSAAFVRSTRCARMMATNHLGTPKAPVVHPVVASAAREVLNKSENERSGVLSTAMSFLGLYRDPTVAATTAGLRLADCRFGRCRATRCRSISSFRRRIFRGRSRWSAWCSIRSAGA